MIRFQSDSVVAPVFSPNPGPLTASVAGNLGLLVCDPYQSDGRRGPQFLSWVVKDEMVQSVQRLNPYQPRAGQES